jgi:hypothetical protein
LGHWDGQVCLSLVSTACIRANLGEHNGQILAAESGVGVLSLTKARVAGHTEQIMLLASLFSIGA